MITTLLRAGAVAAAAVLLAPALPATAIVGGEPDAGEHPFVGQLLFYDPQASDPRFDDPGAWFNCTGTLIDADTVVTAGHCTYGVGTQGAAPTDPLRAGTDVWFSVSEAPDYSVLPASATFAPSGNDDRYAAWSAILDASAEWAQASSTFTHPEFVEDAFLLHDVGVVELSEPITLDEYATLPQVGHLDRYAKATKRTGLFESVGYGLEKSGPRLALGGDTRRKAEQRLLSVRGAFGLRDTSVMFSHADGGRTTGGTCFGDSGGPTFDVSTPALEGDNVVVAVTSFGLTSTCTAGGSYRLDQPDDLAFLADPAGSYDS
jgi:hypothetical protein